MTNASSQAARATDADLADGVSHGDDALAASMEHCRRVAKSRARNFFYGMKLTPEPKRSAMYAIYAFMRACDDLADDAEPVGAIGDDASANLSRIDRFAQHMDALIAGRMPRDLEAALAPIAPAFMHVTHDYPIRPADLHAMLDGQRDDLTRTRCATFSELYDYCYKVASTVGLVCVSVWGYEGGDATLKLAEERGVALQLTNILRDVVEDAERGRVYLPADELKTFGYDGDSFIEAMRRGKMGADERFDRLMTYQIVRARDYYNRSLPLEKRLDPTCRATCWAIMEIYRRLLEKIARDPRRVLTERVRLNCVQKSLIAASAAMFKRGG